MKTKPAIVSCPVCGKPVTWTAASTWRPFCSERCRLIDLGEWLNEERRIPSEEVPDTGIDTAEDY